MFSIDNRIKAELDRISIYYEPLDEDRKAVVSPLIQNAAFMKITLDDLQEAIKTEGCVDEYQNGNNQRGLKTSAALQSYIALSKNYMTAIKTLFSFLPPEQRKSGAFDRFLERLSVEE